ncbi:MAG: hypothetical protein KDB62_09845, partial [Solirubrobacterales bacterium]|nr:hypothetical protein [Solirubrobacterales bacterium]
VAAPAVWNNPAKGAMISRASENERGRDRGKHRARPVAPFWLWAVAIAAAVLGSQPSASGAAGLEGRESDPVVLTGDAVRPLAPVEPGHLVAYRVSGESWEQVPVQVDERVDVDFRSLYPFPDQDFVKGGPLVVNAYADPGTLVGPDDDPMIDDDDEIAMMAADTGERVSSETGTGPDGLPDGPRVEVEVRDPLDDRLAYLYLFRGPQGADQGAGGDYVKYEFDLLAGDYLTAYGFVDGPNPEASSVDTDYYLTGHSDRWIDDELRLKAGGATGVDVLDREKAQFYPGYCGRSTDSFSGYTSASAEGTFIANIDGPVRAIRSYLGANSGPYTQRESVFYERRQDVRTFLRVHAIPQVMQFTDYSAAAAGMTYRNQLNPGGVTIDGIPDPVTPGVPAAVPDAASAWEQVSGPQGSIDIVTTLRTDIQGLGVTSYYLDNASPGGGAETQCTGDASAYGSSGSWINTALPNTDPRTAGANYLTSTKTLFYGGPEASVARAESHRASVDSPLSVASSELTIPDAEPPGGARLKVSARPTRRRIRAGAYRRYRVAVRNRGAAASGRVRVCIAIPGNRVRRIGGRRCRIRDSIPAGNRVRMVFRVRVRNRVRTGVRPAVRFAVKEDGRTIRTVVRRLRVS